MCSTPASVDLQSFSFEMNKRASFVRPHYGFMGDWRMYRDNWGATDVPQRIF